MTPDDHSMEMAELNAARVCAGVAAAGHYCLRQQQALAARSRLLPPPPPTHLVSVAERKAPSCTYLMACSRAHRACGGCMSGCECKAGGAHAQALLRGRWQGVGVGWGGHPNGMDQLHYCVPPGAVCILPPMSVQHFPTQVTPSHLDGLWDCGDACMQQASVHSLANAHLLCALGAEPRVQQHRVAVGAAGQRLVEEAVRHVHQVDLAGPLRHACGARGGVWPWLGSSARLTTACVWMLHHSLVGARPLPCTQRRSPNVTMLELMDLQNAESRLRKVQLPPHVYTPHTSLVL